MGNLSTYRHRSPNSRSNVEEDPAAMLTIGGKVVSVVVKEDKSIQKWILSRSPKPYTPTRGTAQ